MPRLNEIFNLSAEQAHHHLGFVAFETLLLMICITFLIELAGRKTVSQMTMLQMIVTIGIGESVLMPILDKEFSLIKTLVIVLTLIIFLITLEWFEMKFNFLERMLTNKAKVVVENGKLNIKNLRKMRMTVDQLEIELRNNGIESIDILDVCTVEANGRIGYKLKADENVLTLKEFKKYMNVHFPTTKTEHDIFKEVTDDEHETGTLIKHRKDLE